jgi:hypothetical protein
MRSGRVAHQAAPHSLHRTQRPVFSAAPPPPPQAQAHRSAQAKNAWGAPWPERACHRLARPPGCCPASWPQASVRLHAPTVRPARGGSISPAGLQHEQHRARSETGQQTTLSPERALTAVVGQVQATAPHAVHTPTPKIFCWGVAVSRRARRSKARRGSRWRAGAGLRPVRVRLGGHPYAHPKSSRGVRSRMCKKTARGRP